MLFFAIRSNLGILFGFGFTVFCLFALAHKTVVMLDKRQSRESNKDILDLGSFGNGGLNQLENEKIAGLISELTKQIKQNFTAGEGSVVDQNSIENQAVPENFDSIHEQFMQDMSQESVPTRIHPKTFSRGVSKTGHTQNRSGACLRLSTLSSIFLVYL